MHFYNDTEPFVCSWLEQLIKHNHLPHGTIDQRPIQQLTAADLASYTQCHFFAGIGGWPLALRLAGWPDDMPVWTGSCPCQPFSCAGQGRGVDDERHLWPEFRRLIDERHPPIIFGEQVASKAGRVWLDGVRTDLEALGYVVGAADLCVAGVGAPHIRQRLFFCASNTYKPRLQVQLQERLTSFGKTETASAWSELERIHATRTWRDWNTKSNIRVFTSRVSSTVGRLRGYGNAIVPPLAAEFIQAAIEAIQLATT